MKDGVDLEATVKDVIANPRNLKFKELKLHVNILVVHKDNKESDAMKKLRATLQFDDRRTFIKDKYKDAIAPVF